MEVYCIRHEEMTYVPDDSMDHEVLSLAIVDEASVIQGQYCNFDMGCAFCPPPEEFFLVGHEVPSPEEVAEMNATASELFTDWS